MTKQSICQVPYTTLNIHENGDVYLCCDAWVRFHSVGNIFENTFEEIWNGEKARDFRKQFCDDKYKYCDFSICQKRNYCGVEATEVAKDYPETVVLTYDPMCNVDCLFCSIEKHKDISKFDETMENWLPDIAKNAKIISLNGFGEALASKHSRKLMKRCVEINPNTKFEIQTNGVLANKKNFEDLGILNNIEKVIVSVHSTKEKTYNKLVKHGNFKKAMKNIKELATLKKEGIMNKLEFKFVITSINYKEMVSYAKLAKKCGAYVTFLNLVWSGRENKVDKYIDITKKDHPKYNKLLKLIRHPIFKEKHVNINKELFTLKPVDKKTEIENTIRDYKEKNEIRIEEMKEKITKIKNRIRKFFNPEYTSCRFFGGGLMFTHGEVIACCSYKCGLRFETEYHGGPIDWNKILETRKKVIKNAKKGIYPTSCVGCPDLVKKEWNEDYKITELYFNHWEQCNAGCIYCVQNGEQDIYLQKEKSPSKHYPALDKIKELYEKDMLSKDLHVEFIGGDLTLLDETDEIIDLCLKNGVSRMSFHTSGIAYSEAIEKALKEAPQVDFDFSLDSGSPELYKKIKRIDAFDKTVENLKRYVKASNGRVDFFTAKYIIIDGLNDNVEEIEKWLQVLQDIGIKHAKLEVNFKKYLPNKATKPATVPSHYKELYAYFCKRLNELEMENHCWTFSRIVLEEGRIPQ